jgi:RNA recognition motif-containing protein
MNIYIGNLEYKVSEEQLTDLFGQYGEIKSVKVISDKFTGRSKGFAFVEMETAEAGAQAIAALDGSAINNRNISVTEARPQEERPERAPRQGGGGGYGRDNNRGGGGSGYRDRDSGGGYQSRSNY